MLITMPSLLLKLKKKYDLGGALPSDKPEYLMLSCDGSLGSSFMSLSYNCHSNVLKGSFIVICIF